MRQLQNYLKTLTQKSNFPSPTQANSDGLLCFGGELYPEILLDAYFHGIFPWPHEDLPLLWFSPLQRGVLFFCNIHISKSLKKKIRNHNYQFTVNKAFREVLIGCAKQQRKGQKGTWITTEIQEAYVELFNLGYGLSVECWNNESLVGGLYGIDVCGVFSGESMFGMEADVSKLCLLKCVEYLKNNNREWMDIQMLTSVTESLGGTYISQEEFLIMIEKQHKIYFSGDVR